MNTAPTPRWMKSLSMLATLAGALFASGCGAGSVEDASALDEEQVEDVEQAYTRFTEFEKRASFSLVLDRLDGAPEKVCTAVALTTYWLLTSADCVHDEAGHPYTSADAFVPLAGPISQIITHPAYGPHATQDGPLPLDVPDVALLRLQLPLNLGSEDCAYWPDLCWTSPAGLPIPLDVVDRGYAVTTYRGSAPASSDRLFVCDGSGGPSGTYAQTSIYLQWSHLQPMGGYYVGMNRYRDNNGWFPLMDYLNGAQGDRGGPCYVRGGKRNEARLLHTVSYLEIADGDVWRIRAVDADTVADWIDAVIPPNDRVLVIPNDPGAGY